MLIFATEKISTNKKAFAMETKELTLKETQVSKVELIRGEFTPSEAIDIIGALIDQKVNFHEVRKFQRWENDHGCGTEDLDQRISELKQEKAKTKEFLSAFLNSGKTVTINGILDVKVSDPS